jgi:prophage antirepressor-like protein
MIEKCVSHAAQFQNYHFKYYLGLQPTDYRFLKSDLVHLLKLPISAMQDSGVMKKDIDYIWPERLEGGAKKEQVLNERGVRTIIYWQRMRNAGTQRMDDFEAWLTDLTGNVTAIRGDGYVLVIPPDNWEFDEPGTRLVQKLRTPPRAPLYVPRVTTQVLPPVQPTAAPKTLPEDTTKDTKVRFQESDLQSFSWHGHDFRCLILNDVTWFLAGDVTDAFAYSNSNNAIKYHAVEDDREKFSVIFSGDRARDIWFINESGLYALVLGSKLPEAQAFKHFVTSEVLPALRKTGTYTLPTHTLPAPSEPLEAPVTMEEPMHMESNTANTMRLFEEAQGVFYLSLRMGLTRDESIDAALESLQPSLRISVAPLRKLFEKMDARKAVIRPAPRLEP